ncbi:MAG: cytochrome c [Deltaproteobacteria bacterium]|nr:cytochrome c [Deltaproteobacteria bacterium]
MDYIYPAIAVLGILVAVASAIKKAPFYNFIGILAGIYGALKSVALIMPPLPGQVMLMYMSMSVFSLLIYFSIQEETFKAFLEPMRSVLADDDKRRVRAVVFVIIPLLAGFMTYAELKPSYAPPVSARIVHPEPPTQTEFKGETIQILGIQSPLREDMEALEDNLEAGKRIYYQNCFFCHGDDLDGKGHFASVFNPPPLPFRGTDTIAQLPESFVFWRIAKGWRGLPDGSGPWNSSMPPFEDFLTEEEIWQVILFIYKATGNEPRTW